MMTPHMLKCAASLQQRIRYAWVPAAMFWAFSAEAQTPLVGGPGGGEFSAQCPRGQILGGVQLRVGAWIDAIRPLCRTTSVEVERRLIQPGDPRYRSYQTLYDDDLVTYPVSEASPAADWNGGTGGGLLTLSCDIGLRYVAGETPAQRGDRIRASGLPGGIDRLVVSGIYVEAEGKETVTVDRITLRCENFAGGAFYVTPAGGFRAPQPVPEKELGQTYGTNWINDLDAPTFEGPQERFSTGESREVKGLSLCPVRQNGARTVAVGIHGRAGKWLDALGLICDHPVRPPTPLRAQGRVTTGASPAPPRPICESARQARARNSPAAPGLEEQCRAAGAAGEVAPVKAQGRVTTGAPPAPPRAICESARQARARNSPAAPGLEAQCRAAGAAGEVAPITAQGRVRVPAPADAEPAQVPAPMPAGPAITARANPVLVANGEDAGTTTITWTAAPAFTYSEIYLSVDNGEWSEFARGADGSKSTTIKLGTTQTFRMMVYEGQAGTPRIVATLTVRAGN